MEMGKDDITGVISEQTRILFTNIEAIFNAIEESDIYNQDICDWPLAEQIYHTLHSMDQWFINPYEYKESEAVLHRTENNEVFTKIELVDYYVSVKLKIMKYLETLSPATLLGNPVGCQFSRLALILGQYRHFMYHIGLIHGCLRVHTRGSSPTYFGFGQLSKASTQ
jgi:hypothetical protein